VSTKSIIFKNCLLLLLLGLLFTPIIQHVFEFKTLEPLKGAVTNHEDATFSKKEWIDGTYQEKKELYINSNFGFRNFFVRLNNQVDFNLFDKANAKGVIVGKDNYLYELDYIKAYTGEDFIGMDSIDNSLRKLKLIHDTLEKLNKHLLFVFAPSKAAFFPENIPAKYLSLKGTTNYSVFSERMKKLGLNYIDFHKWFNDNKTISKYPLFPQQGTHWSTYGAALAMDSLMKKIEAIGKIQIPHLKYNSFRLGKAYDMNYDIGEGMNLLYDIKGYELAYPNINSVDSINKVKPKILVIGDSFYWEIFYLGIGKCFNSNHRFWYYNKEVYPDSYTKQLFVENLDLSQEINKYNFIIILSTDQTLKNVGWGFLENMNNLYKAAGTSSSRNSPYYINRVKDLVKYIKMNPKWIEGAKERAKEKNVTLDSMLILEAIWQIEHPN
jgi:hypothetical protein